MINQYFLQFAFESGKLYRKTVIGNYINIKYMVYVDYLVVGDKSGDSQIIGHFTKEILGLYPIVITLM